MSTPLSARIAEEYASAVRAHASAADGPRHAAIEALAAKGLPSSRDENWKYANLRSLEAQRFVPATQAPPANEAGASAPANLAPVIPGFSRYVFIDGVFAPQQSAALAATPARISSGAPGMPMRALGSDERFALLNQAFATDSAAIHVPAAAAGAEARAQVELVFVASAPAKAGASYPRIELRLESGADLALIERHVSEGTEPSFVNSAVSVALERGAQLQHYRLQQLNARSTLFDTLSADLGERAVYRLHAINTGAQAARSTLALRLCGEGADLTLAVATLGERQQVQDTYALVEHAAPDSRTTQTFRGIAAGRARVAFNGKIVVSRTARGTDTRQSLRGLLAGPEAEIDLRPQLEIYTDEVRCSHGATAGKLDEDMLFYLLSRGLTPDAAQRLLKWAFLEDVIAQMGLPPLRRQVEEHLAEHLRDHTLRELL
jgi:Fe-S cluster assembly protein SufD